MTNTSPITVRATLDRAWSLPENPEFPASAGAELLIGGRVFRLYGPGLRSLLGKPAGIEVALACTCRTVPDRWGKDAIKLQVVAAAEVGS